MGLEIPNNLGVYNHIQNLKDKFSQAISLLYQFKSNINKEAQLLIFNSTTQMYLNYLAIIFGKKKLFGEGRSSE